MKTIRTREDYNSQYQQSLKDKEVYWADVAQSYSWTKPWDEVCSGDFNDLDIKWFDGGVLNITENCLDRHLEKNADKTAIIWEPNSPDEAAQKITYKELHGRVCQMANVFKAQGVTKGDRVCFYMSMVPELLIGLLACARIGAVHSVIFAGFSARSLEGRINDCQAKLLVTNDESYRGAKTIPLKDICDEALKTCPTITGQLVYKRTGKSVNWVEGRDLWLHEEMKKQNTDCPAEPMGSEDPLFILYTSGSTGKPKGLLHTVAGYMVWAGETFKNVFQTKDDSVYWCSADIGWITGHTYMTYGPLLNGTTQVLFEGIPTWPDAGRFWEVIDKHKVTHFYTAPTAIRALEAHSLDFVTKHNLDSLEVLGTVGEPINEEAWEWYNKHIGQERCPIVDTWWQTETGGIMISSFAGVTPSVTSYATLPMPGVDLFLMDSDAKEIDAANTQGNLCIRSSWPGIARTIFGDHKRYKETYFSTYPGYYFTGDGARRDDNGNYRITGRVDDVINVSGHRIGTAEVEDAINEHPQIVESAVVGYPHKIKGQGIYAFVIPTSDFSDNPDELKVKLHKLITTSIGPLAKPDQVKIVPGLPKTRSGKIMRRILRKIASGETDGFGDTSTLLNPEIVEIIAGN